MEKGYGVPMPSPSATLSPHLHQPGSFPNTVLDFYYRTSLHRRDWLNLLPLVPSPLLEGPRVEEKVPTLQTQGYLPWQPALSLGNIRTFQKLPREHSKTPFSHHLGNYKGFRSSVIKNSTKPKCIFLIIIHIIIHNIPVPIYKLSLSACRRNYKVYICLYKILN